MKTLLEWLDHRTGIKEILHEALYERIPGGARWRYVWGSTLVFTFSLQMITGLFLWTAYSPSAQTAWESVYYIQNQMFLGNIVRGIHHFAAQAMVVLMALHLMQVIIDGAYKAPREVNFWLGLILMKIVLGLALTGYLLPWDQKGYYATQVSTNIMGATPLVGPYLQQIVQGGPQYGHQTLTRFFALHAGLLPGALIAFLALHLYVFRRHGITVPNPNRAPETTFWPDQVLKDGVACLAVLATVWGLAVWKGAELSAPANPAEAYQAARPEWYFLFLFRFLKFEWVEHLGLAFGSIYFPGALVTVLVLMPIIAWVKWGHAFNVAFTAFVTVGVIALTALAFYEDGRDVNHQLAIKEALVDGERTAHLANHFGIPIEGAQGLRRNDPLTMGPRIFKNRCSACHAYDGHDGTGRPLTAEPVAADLGRFGDRDWMRGVLTDFEGHFSPLKKAEWYKQAIAAGGDAGEFLDLTPKDGENMSGWSKENKDLLLKAENKSHLDALIEALVAESGRADLKVNAELVTKGREILDSGDFGGESFSLNCADCHTFSPGESFSIDDGGGDGIPTLTGYASQSWLKAFIADPAAFYGEKNQMPAFGNRLTTHEMDMLVRWMTGDYFRTEEAAAHDASSISPGAE